MPVRPNHRSLLGWLVHSPREILDPGDPDIVQEQLPLTGWNGERLSPPPPSMASRGQSSSPSTLAARSGCQAARVRTLDPPSPKWVCATTKNRRVVIQPSAVPRHAAAPPKSAMPYSLHLENRPWSVLAS